MSRLLTIVIPTYNRPAYLRRTLDRLAPQLDGTWSLIVLDNCSPVPAATLVEEAGLAAHTDVSVIRNPVNVGLCGNIMRALEVAPTEWAIVLGDDDLVSEDYVAVIQEVIARNSDAVFINFTSTLCTRAADFETHGLREFIEKMDNWSNVLFISSGAFHRSLLLDHFKTGYQYIYSLGPHMAVLLAHLHASGGRVVFSSKCVVTCQAPTDASWSRMMLANTTLLLELLPERDLQRIFFRHLEGYFLPLHRIAEQTVSRHVASGENGGMIFFFRRVFAAPARMRPARWLLGWLCQWLADYPAVGIPLLRCIKLLLGKKMVPPQADFSAGT